MLFESSIPYQLHQYVPTPPATPDLSQEQLNAVQKLRSWIAQGKSTIALSGPAGSGKTSLIKALKTSLACDVVVSAMTNKAVDVLRRKGIPDAITAHKASLVPKFKSPGDAIRSYFDMPEPQNSPPEILLSQHFNFDVHKLREAWEENKFSGIDGGIKVLGFHDFYAEFHECYLPKEGQRGVLIVDEASMLGDNLLPLIQKSFAQIILVGDQFQLPPVKSEPVFWDDSVIDSRVTLTEVHRQSKSGQVFEIAERIKANKLVQPRSVVPIGLDLLLRGVPVIVWRNEFRKSLTKQIRQALNYPAPHPVAGELLVCRDTRTFRGTDFVKNSTWKVIETDGKGKCVLEDCLGQRTKVPVEVAIDEYGGGRGLLCRFGYVLTCHTAQGSEWPTVMIHAPDVQATLGFKKGFSRQWLYTAVTRAKEDVIWVSGDLDKRTHGRRVAIAPHELQNARASR